MKARSYIIRAGAIGLLALSVTNAAKGDQNTSNERFIAACVDAILEFLPAPESLQITSIGDIERRDPTFEELLGITNARVERALTSRRSSDPNTNFLFIQGRITFEENRHDIISAPIQFRHNPVGGGLPYRAVRCSIVLEDGSEFGQGGEGYSDLLLNGVRRAHRLSLALPL